MALEEAELWIKMKKESGVLHTQDKLPNRVQMKWKKPNQSFLKCNIKSSWTNPKSMCGGAWILRDINGDVKFHAHEAFLAASNRIAAEFRWALWTLRSLKDIRVEDVKIWSDCGAMIEAIKNPKDWPRYRSYIDRFDKLQRGFRSCKVEISSSQANIVARRIASSVTQEGHFQSYLAAGRPSWLSALLNSEKTMKHLCGVAEWSYYRLRGFGMLCFLFVAELILRFILVAELLNSFMFVYLCFCGLLV
ncbi:putative protein phosphatase 2C-like protein 45 [Cardamine amara subsp. amara]|uniref:RNase H type-1 domain-containing protein n=1 Tax=Cardamine amara subsp. amara TaxID=228776 RepID=A0ABD1C654_CARAN